MLQTKRDSSEKEYNVANAKFGLTSGAICGWRPQSNRKQRDLSTRKKQACFCAPKSCQM
jgi:hypothetical protein